MKVAVSVSTGLVGSKRTDVIEIDEVDLVGYTPEQREKAAEEDATEWMNNTIEFEWRIIK